MSVLLPTTTVLVLHPATTLDTHGHEVAYAWEQRGPFPAHRSGHQPQVSIDRDGASYTVTVLIEAEAWPVVAGDRLHDEVAEQVLRVEGATLYRDVKGVPLSYVKVTAQVL